MNKRVFILTDYRGHFYSSIVYKEASMDVARLKEFFIEKGYEPIVKQYTEIDFRNEDYAKEFILYQSSEDRDLLYKSYIEDILIGLQLQGAILIPAFQYFRAHHNKAFMEILRDISSCEEIKTISGKRYGTYEDLVTDLKNVPGKWVIKPAAGAASVDIRQVSTDEEKRKYSEKASRSMNLVDAIKDQIKPYIRQNYVHRSNHRKKFILQNFVPNLSHDYKILVYDKKYYVLRRMNRKNDFRASGSGIFEWIDEVPAALMNYAEAVFQSFDVPYISMDIGFDGEQCYLFEMQFLSFGQTTLIKSHWYFTRSDQSWVRVEEKPDLEREFVNSIDTYLSAHFNAE